MISGHLILCALNDLANCCVFGSQEKILQSLSQLLLESYCYWVQDLEVGFIVKRGRELALRVKRESGQGFFLLSVHSNILPTVCFLSIGKLTLSSRILFPRTPEQNECF